MMHPTVHMAAQIYKIPKSTLYDRVHNKNVFKLGGRPNLNKSRFLDPNTERQMVEHIRLMKTSGYHVSKNETLSLASKLGKLCGLLDNEADLTRGWLTCFVGRWPDLYPEEKSEVSKSATTMSSSFHNIVAYYDKLRSVMNSHSNSLHRKPHLVFYLEEVVFVVDRNSLSSTVPQVKKRSHLVDGDNVIATLLVCGSALGHIIPPFFVFKKKQPKNSLTDGTCVQTSNTGLVTSAIFKSYIENHLLENLCVGMHELVLLIYDQNTRYIQRNMVDWARQQKLIMYPDPPHIHFSSQPLNFGFSTAFRTMFTDLSNQFLKEHYHLLDVDSLLQISHAAVHESVTSVLLRQMFERAGIYPYSTAHLTKEHILPYTFNQSYVEDVPLSEGKLQRKRKRRKLIKTVEDEDGEVTLEEEYCCMCGKLEPPANAAEKINMITWGECSKCGHWVHLKFCSPVKSLKKDSIFLCGHCTEV